MGLPATETRTLRMHTLRYEKLKANDSGEICKLVEVCSQAGLFYLDLGTSLLTIIEANMPKVIQAQRRFFDQAIETKMEFACELPNHG